MSRESWNKREWRYDPETLASGWVEVLDEYDDPIVETGNVQVEFPWGNIPLQPDEDRDNGTAGNTGGGANDYGWSPTTKVISDVLDPALDNHSIATGIPPYRFPGWNGYPSYLPNDNDNLPGNFVVPDVTGLSAEEAETVLDFAGFYDEVVYVNNAGGATPTNSGTVASQSPTAGHTIEEGSDVTINVYDYVSPETQIFAWNLTDYTATYIEPEYGFAYGNGSIQSELSAAMLSVEPSPSGGGWEGFYLRCTDVAVDSQGVPLFINNGDYLIKYSQYAPGPLGGIQLEVNTLAGWVPFSIPGAWAGFISGNMAIIDKG
jgi:hypothetical protein